MYRKRGKIMTKRSDTAPKTRKALILFISLLPFLALPGWQISKAHAADAFEPDNSPAEANLIILNELLASNGHTLHDESDEDWFVYYFTVDPNYDPDPADGNPPGLFAENHTVLILDSADEGIAGDIFDIIWEAFDRDGNLLATGRSGDRFAPADLTPPHGSGLYFFRIRWDPAVSFAGETIYFLKLQGTGIPKVQGFIKDAVSNQRLANVTVTANLPTPVNILSFTNGFYMLHVRESNIVLTYELQGYENQTVTIDTVVDDHYQLDIAMTPSNPADPLEEFVRRFYLLILGREPDTAGLNGWVNDLSSGRQSGCDIAFGFVFSPEFINRNTSDEDYVDILYAAFFDRQADPAGKNGWISVLQSGGLREDVLEGFLFSQEFANLVAGFGIDACQDTGSGTRSLSDFVERFYRLILGREPDPAGLNGWVDDLSDGRSTACDIAFGFVFSPEFSNRNTSNGQYVDILYAAFFDRQADPAGRNAWINVLQSGGLRGDVLDGFLFSQEFANLAADFGIVACDTSAP